MEIFKLFEATVANVQPGHSSLKDLRRDQIISQYNEAEKTLQTLIRAKEHEIAYRCDLIDMLERCKQYHDLRMSKARQAYLMAKKHAPDSLDIHRSTTPPMSPPLTTNDLNFSTPSSTSQTPSISQTSSVSLAPSTNLPIAGSQSIHKPFELDIPLPNDNFENRSSLDRRLSEFLKTFPNMAQSGMTVPGAENNVKPLPGYYTQQPPPQQPQIAGPTPPMMAMLRFPPPNLLPTSGSATTVGQPIHVQENHETADMDLSDYDESSNTNTGLIPMVATALQQGAGGKQNLRPDPAQPYVAGQHFNNPAVQYTHRINPLPFDPSIMEPRLRDTSSNGCRNEGKQSDRSRHSGSSGSGSGSSGSKHASDKTKYSSPHSSNRSKRR